ncbi:MAG: DUF4835 family protein [Balneolaceae bacterium]
MKWLTSILMCLFFIDVELSFAQEFNCEVSVNSRQISGTSFEYIDELEDDLEAYINRNRWTEDQFEDHERIRCQVQIVLTDADDQYNFTSEVFFSVRRPIYNTNQESSAIVLSDSNWLFSYPRNKNLVFDELQFDNLTSFIDFYMYVILGYDYDTFSELGGSEYYNEAQTIFELGRNSGQAGWGRSIGAQRNRFGLIRDLTNPGYEGLREAFYRYHRHGLDLFTMNNEESITGVVEAMELIRDTKRITNNNYLFDIFFDTKYQEIVALLRTADVQTRLEAYNLLRDIDPAHSSSYERLQN